MFWRKKGTTKCSRKTRRSTKPAWSTARADWIGWTWNWAACECSWSTSVCAASSSAKQRQKRTATSPGTRRPARLMAPARSVWSRNWSTNLFSPYHRCNARLWCLKREKIAKKFVRSAMYPFFRAIPTSRNRQCSTCQVDLPECTCFVVENWSPLLKRSPKKIKKDWLNCPSPDSSLPTNLADRLFGGWNLDFFLF